MGKSSSSRKKNRSKASSQARKRKKSKTRSRKHESKKLRRRFSDDDSGSSTSDSSSYSSSSEDEKYRGESSRIRARKDVKSSKKWGRKRHYSSESSGDSPRASKRKGSKRKRDYVNKKKTFSKKKRRRDYSTSSTSNRSWSCSTCQGDGSSSDEVEFERHRSKRGKEDRDERIPGEVERPSKRGRCRSRSPSRSQFSEGSTHQSEENVWVVNKSRRLRSIIIVAERDNEDMELSKDGDKEEIIHIHGDYPPCRSNDNSDVGNKWGEGDHSSHDEVEKIRLENEKGDDTAVSDLRSNKHVKSGGDFDADDGSQFDESNRSCDGCATTNTVNDLESVLRQRALENLRRFRGGLQTGGRTTVNQNNKSEGGVKESSIPNTESFQTRSNLEDDTRVVGANFSKDCGAEVAVSTETQSGKGVLVPLTRKDTTSSSHIDENMTDTCGNESVPAKQNVACSIRQTTLSGNSEEKVIAGASAVQPTLTAPALTRQLSKTRSTPTQAPEREEHRANLLLTKSSLDETSAVSVTAPPVTQNSDNNIGTDVNCACSSAASESPSLKSTSVETRPDKLQDEAHEGSQFEQKTMSVMRGGEMVKVSYKVYIPKKAPALARRQLKR